MLHSKFGMCELRGSLRLSFDSIYINHLHCFVCVSELVKRCVQKMNVSSS
jgi:hypothetical protein